MQPAEHHSRRSKKITTKRTYTEQEIRAYGVRMNGRTAIQIVYDVGRTRAYQMLQTSDHDLPVLKRGNKYIVATSAVLRILGLDNEHPAKDTPGTDHPA